MEKPESIAAGRAGEQRRAVDSLSSDRDRERPVRASHAGSLAISERIGPDLGPRDRLAGLVDDDPADLDLPRDRFLVGGRPARPRRRSPGAWRRRVCGTIRFGPTAQERPAARQTEAMSTTTAAILSWFSSMVFKTPRARTAAALPGVDPSAMRMVEWTREAGTGKWG